MSRLALCVTMAVSIAVSARSQQQPRQQTAVRFPDLQPIPELPKSPDSSASKLQALEAHIVGLEKQGWEAVKKQDYAALANLMGEDYREIGTDGLLDKEQALENARRIALIDFAMSDVKLTLLAKDLALLTYKAVLSGTFKSTRIPAQPFYYGVVYSRRRGKWQTAFTQETPSK